MADDHFEVLNGDPGLHGEAPAKRGPKFGLTHVIASGVVCALAAAGIALAVTSNAVKPAAQADTAEIVATAPAPAAQSVSDKDADTEAPAKSEDADQSPSGTAVTTQTDATTPDSSTTVSATETAQATASNATATQSSGSQGGTVTNANSNTNPNPEPPREPKPVWVEEQGHWEYTTVTDYETRQKYREVPNYVEFVMYYCSERDFESTDITEVIAHCEEHGTDLRSEVRQVQDGYIQEPDGTEQVAVGTHQELDRYVIDIPGHWE